MNDIFADSIRSIAVSNGVVRIDLGQLRRVEGNGDGEPNLKPETVARLLIPITSLNDFARQFTNTLRRVRASVNQQQARQAQDADVKVEEIEEAAEEA